MHEPMRFPEWLQEETQSKALRLLSHLDSEDAQRVIDEWIGAWVAGEIRVSALGYLKALVKCCHDGALSTRFAGGNPETDNTQP